MSPSDVTENALPPFAPHAKIKDARSAKDGAPSVFLGYRKTTKDGPPVPRTAPSTLGMRQRLGTVHLRTVKFASEQQIARIGLGLTFAINILPVNSLAFELHGSLRAQA